MIYLQYIFVYTDFEHKQLSKIKYNELIQQFNGIYNLELLKEQKLIDKTSINCMYCF